MRDWRGLLGVQEHPHTTPLALSSSLCFLCFSPRLGCQIHFLLCGHGRSLNLCVFISIVNRAACSILRGSCVCASNCPDHPFPDCPISFPGKARASHGALSVRTEIQTWASCTHRHRFQHSQHCCWHSETESDLIVCLDLQRPCPSPSQVDMALDMREWQFLLLSQAAILFPGAVLHSSL